MTDKHLRQGWKQRQAFYWCEGVGLTLVTTLWQAANTAVLPKVCQSQSEVERSLQCCSFNEEMLFSSDKLLPLQHPCRSAVVYNLAVAFCFSYHKLCLQLLSLSPERTLTGRVILQATKNNSSFTFSRWIWEISAFKSQHTAALQCHAWVPVSKNCSSFEKTCFTLVIFESRRKVYNMLK